MALTDKLAAIATAIRSKTGKTGKLTLTQMASEINGIVIPTLETPSINVSTGGLITASANGKSNTKQLTTQAAKTVTPTKAEQTAVASGSYTTGAVKVGAIPSEYIVPSGNQDITQNGSYDVSALASVLVSVAGGGGGLPSGIAAFDFGTYSKTSATTTAQFQVDHKLGVVPDFVMFYSPTNISSTYSMLMAIRGSIVNWRSGYNSFYFYHGNSTSTVTITNNNNANYGISNMTASSFKVQSHSTSYYWRAGTYQYIAIKFA